MVVGGLVVLGVVVLVVAVPVIEVMVAGNGVKVTERDPSLIDVQVDEAGRTVGRDGPDAAGAPGRPLRVVWLGDSLAAGVGTTDEDGAVARQVARRAGRALETEVLAVSGARIGDVLDQQLPRLTGAPDIVFISAGANDTTHVTSLDDFRQRYEAVLARLPATTSVVLLGVPDMGSTTRLAQPLRAIAGIRANQLDNVVHDLARTHDLAYVNIASQTGPKFRADPDRYFAPDHYHPNDAGYTVWADAIAPVLAWQLARLDHPGVPAPPLPQESV